MNITNLTTNEKLTTTAVFLTFSGENYTLIFFITDNFSWFTISPRTLPGVPAVITYLMFVFQGASLGYELLAHVFAHLDILETDYFGLQYTDEKSVTRWIDQYKSIKKQTCKQRGQCNQLGLISLA